MADIVFQIPDAPGTEVTVRQSFWTGAKILKDGQPLARASGRRGPYLLAMPDGTQREIDVRGMVNLSVVVDGHTYPLERRLQPYEYVLAGIPLVLALPGLTGGALGFALGFGGALANTRIAHSAGSGPMRALKMLGLSALLIAVYLGVIIAVSVLIAA